MKKVKILPIFLIYIEIFLLFFFIMQGEVHAQEACYCDDGGEPGGLAIVCYDCSNGISDCHLSLSGCPGGGCFTGDASVAMVGGEDKPIENIEAGDVVKSFDAQTGEIRDAAVSGIHKTQASGYYVLKTESGREVKVTGEHPFLAIKSQENNQIIKFQIIKSFLENVWEKLESMIL